MRGIRDLYSEESAVGIVNCGIINSNVTILSHYDIREHVLCRHYTYDHVVIVLNGIDNITLVDCEIASVNIYI